MYRFLYPAILIIMLTLLISCTTPDTPSSPQVMVIATETAETLPPPTLPAENKSESSATTAGTAPILVATKVPTATNESVDWLTTTTVEGDRYILGNPHAPIRLIDFSDFL